MACTARELNEQYEWASTNAWSFHSPYVELEDMLQERVDRINEILASRKHQAFHADLVTLRDDSIEEINNLRAEFADCECEDHASEED